MSAGATAATSATEESAADRGAADRKLAGLAWAHLLNDGAANYLPGVLPAVLVAVQQPVQMAGVLIASRPSVRRCSRRSDGWRTGSEAAGWWSWACC